jgi:hypothetical protein
MLNEIFIENIEPIKNNLEEFKERNDRFEMIKKEIEKTIFTKQ